MRALSALGVAAAGLTSLSSKEETAATLKQLEAGKLALVYATPERVISSKRFMAKLEKLYTVRCALRPVCCSWQPRCLRVPSPSSSACAWHSAQVVVTG